MNIFKLALLSLVFMAGPALWAEPTDVPPPNAADPLAEALPILQAKCVDFQALNYKEGDHLSDLIDRSGGKIALVASETKTSTAPASIATALLPGGIIYWRLASFFPEKSWADLATQLEQARPTATGIILDLRSNTTPEDYHGAAQMMEVFAPGDSTLSKYDAIDVDHGIRVPNHPIRAPIVVLTNNQTTGAAEALAACLKTDGALIVGRATRGNAAVFAEQKLSSGQILRFAVENISLADGTPLFGHPVMPDICLTVDDHAEKAALMLIRDNHILDVIQESAERHRMSEASLVRGQDPEWDDYLASLEQKPVLLSLPIIHDVVLVRALDSLKAIRFSQGPLPAQATTTANASPPLSTSVQ